MRSLLSVVCNVMRDETGGEVLEYALIVGLIVIAGIMFMGKMGVKVLAKWTSIDDSLGY